MTTTHAITFTGELLDGFERAEVMARFAARFGLKGVQVDKVFCGQPVTLKKGLDEAKARAYVKALNELGMRTISSSPFDVVDMPPSTGYSIVFDGSVVAGHDREAVKRAAAQRLKFSDAQRDRLFSGSEVTMKRGLDEEKARHYAETLHLLGMNARVEPPLPALETATASAPKPELASAPTPHAQSVTEIAQPAEAVKSAIAPDKAAADAKNEAKLSAAEASLMQTQFSPEPAEYAQSSFPGRSLHDATSIGDDDDAKLHEALRESPLAKPMPATAAPAPENAAKAPTQAAKGDNMMATVVNADALKDYEDALAEDPAIEALRAENDPSPEAANETAPDTTAAAAPRKTTPEAVADALKSAAAKSPAAAGTTATSPAKVVEAPVTAKAPDAKTAEKVDKRDAASPVHEQDTVLAELDSGRTAVPRTTVSETPEPEEKRNTHIVLIALVVVAAAVAAWLLMTG